MQGKQAILVLVFLLFLLPGISISQACESNTVDADCSGALLPEQRPCMLYYCDPDAKQCVYDPGAFTGRACSITEEIYEPNYHDPCHVDVCIGGVCVINAEINSSDPTSAGGMPPLTTNEPWMTAECRYNSTSGHIDFYESEVHPFCGYWPGCEAGETSANCCEDCGCPVDEICYLGTCTAVVSALASGGFAANWATWAPIVVLALIIGYFLAALAYMASHIVHSPQLRAWSKNEIYETSVSAWLAGAAIFFVGVLNNLTVELLGAGYEQQADMFLGRLSLELLQVYGLMVKGIFAMGMLTFWGSVSIPIAISGVVNIGLTGQFMPFGGMSLLSNTLVMFTNILSFAIFSVLAQKVMLDFVLQVGFRILLPIAIVLRCFTFTRKFGTTLIAIAIGA
ncbi:MAG: hypothetical protein ABIG39_04925, partial [Candidatus Micrarchaeota archaeon]